MPNTLLAIDQYSVVSWDKYAVVTLFSHLLPHHISLLEECFKSKPVFKALPTIIDCVRIPEISLRERELLLNLKESLPQYVILSNPALNYSLQKAGIYGHLPITTDFKSALQNFGIPSQPKLDATFVNAFVDCTVKVFGAQTGELPRLGKPVAQKSPVLSDIFGIIPTQSTHFSGKIILSFSEEVLKEIFFKVFNYEPEKINCELDSFLSEILEVIHETTRTELKSKGFVFYPSNATVVRQSNLSEHLSNNQLFLNVPLQTVSRTFQVCIGVEAI